MEEKIVCDNDIEVTVFNCKADNKDMDLFRYTTVILLIYSSYDKVII